jgi:hypothetical protein
MIAAALAALALAAPCDLHGTQPFTFPDVACSPGVIAHVPSKAEACDKMSATGPAGKTSQPRERRR